MKTLILTNIISSNSVYKLNSYTNKHKKELGDVLVAFCSRTESNRRWRVKEKIKFKYVILKDKKIELRGNDLFTYFYNPEIFKLLTRFNPDRIIIGGWDQFAYQISFVWGWFNHKHLTLWSGSTVNERSWRRTLSLPLVKFFIKISTDYIAYGLKAEEYLISLGANPQKISIFMNDVNGKFFINESLKWHKKRDSIKKTLGIKTKFNFIYVGQLIDRKGVLDLVRAFGTFKQNNPDWGLVIAGYGKQENLIKDYVKNNKINNVYFFGNIEQYDLPRIYVACDSLILPSIEEVWGLVVNESLYCGLKVLVSDRCGCVPDLVKPGQNGYVFDPYKPGDLLVEMNKVSRMIDKTISDRPFFSIITSTLNSSKYLPRNIRSVKEQTFKDFEHLFIDGYSGDRTISLINKYKEQNPKFVRLYKRKAKGISNAMNEGIKLAKGNYLIFLHSDDSLYDRKVLDDTHSYLVANPELEWLHGKINVVEETGESIGKYPDRVIYKYFPKYFLKYYNTIPHQAVFMKKWIFEKFGIFDERLSSMMDVDLWLRIKTKTNWNFYNRTISNFMIRKGAQTSGIIRKSENDKNTYIVRARYLNSFEMGIYRIVKMVVDRYNVTFR